MILASLVRSDTTLRPDPGTARDWLRQELAHREYQPSLPERFWRWVHDLLDQVRASSTSGTGPGHLVSLILLVLLVVAVAVALSRLRADRSAPAEEQPVFGEQRLPAVDHRRAALEALEAQRWEVAVVEGLRALAAGLVERHLVPDDLAATAHEITARAGRSFPDLAERLDAAAVVFDRTRYGDRAADEQEARAVVALEEEVRGAAPRSGSTAGPVAAVPR